MQYPKRPDRSDLINARRATAECAEVDDIDPRVFCLGWVVGAVTSLVFSWILLSPGVI